MAVEGTESRERRGGVGLGPSGFLATCFGGLGGWGPAEGVLGEPGSMACLQDPSWKHLEGSAWPPAGRQ